MKPYCGWLRARKSGIRTSRTLGPIPSWHRPTGVARHELLATRRAVKKTERQAAALAIREALQDAPQEAEQDVPQEAPQVNEKDKLMKDQFPDKISSSEEICHHIFPQSECSQCQTVEDLLQYLEDVENSEASGG